jgi:hypothetical protein
MLSLSMLKPGPQEVFNFIRNKTHFRETLHLQELVLKSVTRMPLKRAYVF